MKNNYTIPELELYQPDRDRLTTIRFEIIPGCVYLISGDNGSGKTTFLEAIFNLLSNENKRFNCLFMNQEYRKLLYNYKPVWWNIVIPKIVDDNIHKFKGREIALNYLSSFGVPASKLIDLYPTSLSGGERQLVVLSRFFLSDHNVLLLDEPMSALDSRKHKSVTHTICKQAKLKNKIIIMVSHHNLNKNIIDSFSGFEGTDIYISSLDIAGQ